jgi:predicted nucleotidyltransferase
VNILALHKVKNAYLFGSVLTDRFNSASDVDFLVNYDPSMDPLERSELLWTYKLR